MKITELFKRKNSSEFDSRVFSAGEDKENAFRRSVRRLSPQDIPTKVKSDGKGKLMASAFAGSIRYMFLVLTVLIFAGSIFALGYYLSNDAREARLAEEQSEDFYQDGDFGQEVLLDFKTRANQPNPSMSDILSGNYSDVIYESGVYNEEFERARAKLYELKRQNADVWGWITVPNTNIDYPVMLTTDNEYYLYRSFYGSATSNGSIFADFLTQPNLMANRNTIIYGHNVVGSSIMFNKIVEYSREDVFRNRRIILTTVDGIYTFEVFAVYNASAKYNYYIKTDFKDDRDFITFIDTCRGLSLYQKNINITSADHILTLSTCTMRGDNQRWAVHAKLIAVSS